MTDVAGELLKAHLHEKVSFALSKEVTEKTWTQISDSLKGSQKDIEEQLELHKAWPDRVAALEKQGTSAKSDL